MLERSTDHDYRSLDYSPVSYYERMNLMQALTEAYNLLASQIPSIPRQHQEELIEAIGRIKMLIRRLSMDKKDLTIAQTKDRSAFDSSEAIKTKDFA